MGWKQVAMSGSAISQFVNDIGYLTSTGSFDIDSFPNGLGITVASTDKLLLSDAGTEKYIEVNQLANGLGLGTMASQSAASVNITGGTIGSGTTINKSPVITLGGDLTGNTTLTNLGNVTLTATIASTAVEYNMLNANTIHSQTAYSSNLTSLDEFIIWEDTASGLKKITYSTLSASLAATGFIGSAGVGSGDVNGAASSTDNAVVRFDSTTGKLIQNSSVIIDDSNNVSGVNNLTINGDLYVNGTTTYVNTSNLLIEDKFILLASGSHSSPGDGGIIIEGSTENTGIALFWDNSSTRWALDNDLSAAATTGTPDAYMGVIESSTSDPSANPTYGGATGNGTIHVNTSNSTVWVFVQ